MVFSSSYITDKSNRLKTSLVHRLPETRRKKAFMSLGNGIDPLEVIDSFGADALRFTLQQVTSGNDMRYYDERVTASRNFANKIWNSARFILMNLDEGISLSPRRNRQNLEIKKDKWILSRANSVAREMTENMDKYELGIAVQKVYDFAWNEFCDWYIEMVKSRLYNDEDKTSKQVALYTLKKS